MSLQAQHVAFRQAFTAPEVPPWEAQFHMAQAMGELG